MEENTIKVYSLFFARILNQHNKSIVLYCFYFASYALISQSDKQSLPEGLLKLFRWKIS